MMSSPSFSTMDSRLSGDQQQQQLNASFSSVSASVNGTNGGTASDSINAAKFESETDKQINASSLPTSSTTSTISTSNSNATFSTNIVNNGTDDVCRDFLRNVCRRGKACRFKHPDQNEVEVAGSKGSLVFCHDFQNRECRRENCRFLHCSKQEEELFRSTGKLPQNVQGQTLNEDPNKSSTTPICKDFINGICRRAPGRCKFRHPPVESFPQVPSPTNRTAFDGRNGQRASNFSMCSPNNSHTLDFQAHYGRQQTAALGATATMIPSSYGYGESYTTDNPNKRKRAFDSIFPSNTSPFATTYNDPSLTSNPVHGYSMHSSSQPFYAARPPVDSRYLEEENAALRRRIDELKKQVTELVTTNDFLMEQINQFRVRNAAGAPAAAVAVATATSVASLQPQAPPPGVVSSTAAVGLTAPLSQSINLQAPVGPPQPPPPAGAVIGALPPSSIVSSIASISLPTVTAPVSLVNSSATASLVSYTPALHSTNPWPLGVDQ